MDYLDEKLLELKKVKKLSEYNSLETGFYIEDVLVEFERIVIPEVSISVCMPKTFVNMPLSIAKVKYPSESRPLLIKTSLDTRVCFTFNKLDFAVAKKQLLYLSKQFEAILRRTNPAIVFYDNQNEDIDDAHSISWFDYKGYAIDEQVYYIMYLMNVKGGVLHGTFNCEYTHVQEWKEAAKQVILSIKEESEENI